MAIDGGDGQDMKRNEQYRIERRETEKAIFDILRDQNGTLARIEGRQESRQSHRGGE